ncbi:protein-disulfide reductase DsbD [Nitrosophilus kaiyonis]|uniref:protein-disulfide reductase DsbD n=1 Tax=Nitrosophilus kaiyonis TaxID=2930200 RepID=UPI00249173DF|nr:protein-disulfide reductase DsbD [Nitrosophilus kaiyonis]
MKKYLIIFTIFISYLFAFGSFEMNQKILEPNEAFKPSMKIKKDGLEFKIDLAEGIDVYKDKIKLKLISPQKKDIPLSLPPAKEENGEKLYYKNVTFFVPFKDLPIGEIKLELHYQGCSKAGLCYPPLKKEFIVNVPKIKKEKKVTKKFTSEEESIASTLKHKNIFIILLTFFGFGLLLALTPCVFPMIPILSSIIVGTKNITAKKAFLLSLVYVLSMSVTYTIAGVLAGLFGSNLQAAFQNPWIISIFALIFVALALSMFGFYEIGLPASLQTKLSKKSDEASHKGGIIGTAIMGFLSALIVGPCVAPPLAGALIYIGQTGDALLGGAALFALSLGMGAPLLLIGTGAGKFMPKPGAWMSAVSKVFGVIMLGVAIWMLERVFPPMITMILWASLFIGSAVYLRTFEKIEENAHWFNYLKKSIGLILFIYGIFIFFGAFTGAKNIFDPLKVIKEKENVEKVVEKKVEFKKIHSLKELNEILKEAKKPVLVDFWAKWCVSCKELEEITFKDKRVRERFKDFLLIQADVSSNSKENQKLMKHFNIYGPPAILFFKDGKELKDYRIIGYKPPEDFLKVIDNVIKEN